MPKNVVSVDIGSRLIRLVQLSQASGKTYLEKVELADNPVPNFRTPEGGAGKNEIIRVIRDSLKKGRIKVRDAVSSLGGPSNIIQYFSFPLFSGKELESAVHLEAQRVMGPKLNAMETDFQVLSRNESGTGRQEILFAAVPKEMVSQRMDILQGAGLNPIAVDVDCLALANCFLRLKNLAPDEHVMVLNVGARLISLGILGRDNLYFIRDISLKLKGTLDFKEKSILDRATGEIGRSIHYYQGKASGKNVARIFLTGGAAVAPETSDLLSKALQIPVERWNPLENVEFDADKLGAEFGKSQGYLLAIAIGLALREEG